MRDTLRDTLRDTQRDTLRDTRFRKFLETWHTFRTPKVIFFNFGKSAKNFFLLEKNPTSIFKIGDFLEKKNQNP